MFILDKYSKICYLVDTGADLSIIPVKWIKKPTSNPLLLYAVNNTTIKTYGQKLVNLNLGLRRPFTWNFIVADVSKSIIGADFLSHYGLLIDMKNQQLLDCSTDLKIKGQIKLTSQISEIKTIPRDIKYSKLINEVLNITKPSLFTDESTKHDVKHKIETNTTPIS